jgi:outer membrane protein assembly factor BamE (lipoprotein component of BamABCDE complex)
MALRSSAPFLMIAAAGLLSASLSACSMGSGMAFSTNRIEGYQISPDALAQIRVGQSQDLVVVVLGSPQTTNAFAQGSGWYYVQTKVSETAFGLTSVIDRTVLAIYFDKNRRVADKAIYSLKDGKVVTLEGRKTQGYGEDRTFIQSFISSFTSSGN